MDRPTALCLVVLLSHMFLVIEGQADTVTVNVSEGSEAILPCLVDNPQNHMVVWQDSHETTLTFDDRRLVNDPRVSVERPTAAEWNLHFQEVRSSDQGEYFCLVNASPVQEKKVILNVQVGPREVQMDTSDLNVSVTVDDTAVLPCHVENLGPRSIVWRKDTDYLSINDMIFTDNPRVSLDRHAETDWNLHISDVRPSDQGDYICQVTASTDISRKVHLNVQTSTAPAVTETQPDEITVTATVNGEAVLPCVLEYNGPQQVLWMDSNHDPLTVGDRRIINDQRLSLERPTVAEWNLHIQQVRLSDRGVYFCEVNTQPAQRKTVVLNVPEINKRSDATIVSTGHDWEAPVRPPFEMETSDLNVTVTENNIAVLPCHVGNLGTNTILWLKHENSLNANAILTVGSITFTPDTRVSMDHQPGPDWNLIIRNVRPSDQGDYFCRISGREMRRKVTLIVQEIGL